MVPTIAERAPLQGFVMLMRRLQTASSAMASGRTHPTALWRAEISMRSPPFASSSSGPFSTWVQEFTVALEAARLWVRKSLPPVVPSWLLPPRM